MGSFHLCVLLYPVSFKVWDRGLWDSSMWLNTLVVSMLNISAVCSFYCSIVFLCSAEVCMSVHFSHIPVFSVPDLTEEGSKSFCWDMGSVAHRPVALWLLPGTPASHEGFTQPLKLILLCLFCVWLKVFFHQYSLSWVFFGDFFFSCWFFWYQRCKRV